MLLCYGTHGYRSKCYFLQAQRKRIQETKRSPFDKPLAKFGVVPNMPEVWWSVFPFKRR